MGMYNMNIYTNTNIHLYNNCFITSLNLNFNGGVKTTSTSKRGSSFLARNSSSATTNAAAPTPNILSSTGTFKPLLSLFEFSSRVEFFLELIQLLNESTGGNFFD